MAEAQKIARVSILVPAVNRPIDINTDGLSISQLVQRNRNLQNKAKAPTIAHHIPFCGSQKSASASF